MFQIDRFGRTPIYEQVIEQTQLLITTGALKAGDQLPSVRALSQTLSVNPNTLQKAYAELERRGLCRSAPGNGRFVTAEANSIILQRMEGELEALEKACMRLRAAGVPLARVIERVYAAYGKEGNV